MMQGAELRAAVIERLKQLVDDRARRGRGAADARRQRAALRGRAVALPGRTDPSDLRLHRRRTSIARTNPSDAERMAIVATGGYGRGLLAPGSDIDLLFLLPYKQTPWGESVAEYMLYLLWDLGFKVGHATRTVDQCLQARDVRHDDPHLAARCAPDPWRRAALRGAASSASARRSSSGTARAFIDAKMAERDERHKRSGESRYQVEPNVKDGKGGLRDLHTLHWLAKYLYGQDVGAGRGRRRHLHARGGRDVPRAARTSCGPCAATCISSPAAPRSG